MVEAVWSESARPSLTVPQSQDMYTFQYQQQQSQFPVNNSITQPSRRESLLSPGAGRRTKQHRGMTGKSFIFLFEIYLKKIRKNCAKMEIQRLIGCSVRDMLNVKI